MKLWRIFEWFASASNGDLIFKTGDHNYLDIQGNVYCEQGSLIIGSDGSVRAMVSMDGRAGPDGASDTGAVILFSGGAAEGSWNELGGH